MDNAATFADILADLQGCIDVVSAFYAAKDGLQGGVGESLKVETITKHELEQDWKILEERLQVKPSSRILIFRLLAIWCQGDWIRELIMPQLMARLHWIRTKQDGDALPDIFNVEEQSLTCLTSCGRGAFASVSKGTWLGIKCAKKVFSIDTEDSGSPKSFVDLEGEFKQEVSMLARLNHPNIVKFLAHGKCMGKSKWERFIVMELMERSLHDVIEEFSCRRRKVPFSYCEAIDIMLQVAKAMHYLHMQELAHRDLKPSNVLVSASSLESSDVGRYMCIKIADFGLSKVVDNLVPSILSQDKVGTTVYRAPEMASKGSCVSFPKADVYSFGIMCSEILSGNLPFDGVPRCDLDRRLLEEDIRPKLPTNCAGLTSLIKECWAWDATQRPRFLEIFERLKSLKSELLMVDHLHQEPSFEDKEPKSSSSMKHKENIQQPIQVMNGGDRQTDEIKMLASVHGVINAYSPEDQSLVSRLKNATPPELGEGQWDMKAKEPQNDDVANDGDILTQPWPLNGCSEDMRLSYPSVQTENHSQQLCANHLEQRGASGDATNLTSPRGSSPSFSWIQPVDLSGLKQQFLELLNRNGGRIALERIPGEYTKHFYQPLDPSNYHTSKLVDLIKKMGSPLSINRKGRKILHLASVQLSDLSQLEQQFVEILNLNRGKMVLSNVPAEYDKHFGQPFYLCDYDASKLSNLIKKMPDSLRIVVAAGQPDILCLAK
jgi:serine/threonine protein kinase